MRLPLLIAAVLVSTVAAAAQSAIFYAERGYWTIFSGAKFCRAFNRPAEDFNYAPYDALQIAVDAKGTIAVDVFFWPGALHPDNADKLKLTFPTRKEPIVLAARPTMGDFMLASDRDQALWRALQDAPSVDVSVEGRPDAKLHFALSDIMWVLNSLTTCQRVLPKE